MRKPVAIITGDIHFTPTTLDLATSVVNQMKEKAKALKVPMVLNGDTLDSKAIVRGECANRLIELLDDKDVETIVNVGNHDLISEKGKAHVLNFLKPYATVVEIPTFLPALASWVIPYHGNNKELQEVLNGIEKGSRLIIHQGVETADLGHYVTDKSSLPKESYADFRVIGSHYHKMQDIKCGRPRKGAVGLFSFCGSPFTHTFGEAKDGPKGFQILFDDGLMEQVPTNLRTHRIIEINAGDLLPKYIGRPDDLLWFKIKGPQSELAKIKKKDLGAQIGHNNFKLDLIPIDSNKIEDKADGLQDTEILDMLIGAMPDAEDHKAYLKKLWREIL